MTSLTAEETELVEKLRKKYSLPSDMPSKNETTCEIGYGPETIPLLRIISRLDSELDRHKRALAKATEGLPCCCEPDEQCDYCFTKDLVKEILEGAGE